MQEDNYYIISQKRYDILSGSRLDFLYKMSPMHWRGEMMHGEVLIDIRVNKCVFKPEYGQIVIIDIQKRPMYLGMAAEPVIVSNNFNIINFCNFMEWDYSSDEVLD